MILVDNKPISSLPKDDLRLVWYNTERAKIANRKEPLVIKKIASYRIDSKGVRRKPDQRIGVQSRKLISTARGMELWGCCATYKKNDDETLSLNPNFYYFENRHTLDPARDSELIFYLTCIIDLNTIGFTIDNPELEAREINEKEIAELDVKYAIHRKLESLSDLRSIASAWGVSNVEVMHVEQLRRVLFDTVKQSEENLAVTKKGYKEFMDDVFQSNPELTAMRALVNKAITKGVLQIAHTSRRVTYAGTGDLLFIIPLDHKDRAGDYLADKMLEPKFSEMAETINQDVNGVQEEFKMSVADIDAIKTREGLKKAAAKLGVGVPPTMKEENLRAKLIEKVSAE